MPNQTVKPHSMPMIGDIVAASLVCPFHRRAKQVGKVPGLCIVRTNLFCLSEFQSIDLPYNNPEHVDGPVEVYTSLMERSSQSRHKKSTGNDADMRGCNDLFVGG